MAGHLDAGGGCKYQAKYKRRHNQRTAYPDASH
jgi:hypothetical protein